VVNGNTLRKTRISALATYVPPTILDNHRLSQLVETTDEWILQRTGIKTRHIVEKGVATSDMGKEAALKALAQAGLTPDDIRPRHRRDDDAGHVLSEHGGARAAQDWRLEVLGVRPGRRLLRVQLLAERGEPARLDRQAPARARHRRRHDVEHHRLHRSHHLRAVRATAPAR